MNKRKRLLALLINGVLLSSYVVLLWPLLILL